jgi:protein LSM14
MAVPQEDFDFEGAFMKFRKDELFNRDEIKMAMPAQAAATYVKDDFFDSMSCEALEKAALMEQQQQQPGSRSRFAEMRKMDMETFGAAGGVHRVNTLNSGRGRGGPGGRGRGDGRIDNNRGGYNQGSGYQGNQGNQGGGYQGVRGSARGVAVQGRGGNQGRGGGRGGGRGAM